MGYGAETGFGAGIREGDWLAGKYRIERVLGAGGMGVVLAAYHQDLDKKVAIKLMRSEMLSDAGAVARFLREARAAVRIESEHVARVLDVGRAETGAPYLVMEFLEGGDLQGFLRERGPLPVEQAVDFMVQACVGVAEAHALGIVHRDLKPANLFRTRRSDGQPLIKVLDFGISKVSDLGGETGLSMTKTGSVMGSPLYMSPEQMRSAKDVDARSDIWALGVILFELLTGRTPFVGDTLTEVTVQVITEPAPPVRLTRPDVPPALEAAILRCLQKDRRARFANVAELAAALVDYGPRRVRASVERIAGIAHAAGMQTSAPSSSAPVPRGAETVLAPETMTPFGRTAPEPSKPGRRSRTAAVAAIGAAAFLAVAGVGATLALRAPVPPVTPGTPVAETTSTLPPPKSTDPTGKTELPPKASTSESAVTLTPAVTAAPTAPATAAATPAATHGPSVPRPETTATGTHRPPPAVSVATAATTGAGAGGASASSAGKAGASGPAEPSAPCKLIQTFDRNGEAHFSCPCPKCE